MTALSYLNASYTVFTYAARRYAGISAVPPPPPAISIELSSRCNLACPECVAGAGMLVRKNDYVSVDLAEEIAMQVRGHLLSAWLSFQGEPLLHPDFFRIAGFFRGMNPVIATNGHYLDRDNCIGLADSPLKKIIISYDGVTPEAYTLYRRGGDHALVTEGITRLAATIRERHSKLKIVIQFLLHRGNEHEAKAADAFARSVGAHFRIKTMQVLDPARAGQWMPSDPRRSRYAAIGQSWKSTTSPVRGCTRMWSSAVITTDADVVPCCFDKNAAHVMGNLGTKSFMDIWRNEKYRSFRNMVMQDRRLVDICSDCPQGRNLFFSG